MVGNTVIQRLYTGTLWAEGVAWNGVGRYLVWSDIPNNRQMRWIEEDGRVTVFRSPSGFSNGNTFDYEGRQLSCEHGNRRVARYEYNGTVTVIADKFQGKRLNSPNDIAVHPDGGIWFTDPIYGIRGYYEGFKGESEIKEAVYRVDPKTGQIDKVTDDLNEPNGICFSPDYKKVYICDTGTGREIRVYDIDGKTLRNSKRFVQLDVPDGAPPRRRYPLRHRWQRLGRSAARRASDRPQRRPHRHDPSAGKLRQHLLRRHAAQPAVYGGQPVALRGVCGHHRGAHRMKRVLVSVLAGSRLFRLSAQTASGIEQHGSGRPQRSQRQWRRGRGTRDPAVARWTPHPLPGS